MQFVISIYFSLKSLFFCFSESSHDPYLNDLAIIFICIGSFTLKFENGCVVSLPFSCAFPL